MQFVVTPSAVRGGTLRVPGDKSISHRALMLGAIAEGETSIDGFLPGADCLATLTALKQLGVSVHREPGNRVRIEGVGLRGLQAPGKALDLGNSGTAMRLFAGLLCAQAFDSRLVGDASLSSRPMARVIVPLEEMGAVIASHDGRPPLQVRGGQNLRGIDYRLPVASAQVKSALLLAGLYAEGDTVVREPAVTRDHSERMLLAMGADLAAADGVVRLSPGRPLQGRPVPVPADLSSATFALLAALIAEDATVTLTDVGINPTRDGVLRILREMGGDIRLSNERVHAGEPVADIEARASALRGIEVDPALVPLAIDEFPALFIAAACARGTSVFRGLEELRVKESDRIRTMVRGLQALGVAVEETPDGARIRGGSLTAGQVDSEGDHRIAMAFAVAATRAAGAVRIRDTAAVDTSFPGFANCMASLGVAIRTEEDR